MIKNFSIQSHGIYQSHPYSKFTRQASNNCKTPSKSQHKNIKINIKIKTKDSKMSSQQTLSKKIKNKSMNKNIVNFSNNHVLYSPKTFSIKAQKITQTHNSMKQQTKINQKEKKSNALSNLPNVQSRIQLQSTIRQESICCQITYIKTKTPIKKFLNLIRQSKKDEYLIKRLQFHSQKLDSLLQSHQLQNKTKNKCLEIQDIILQK